MQRKDDEWLSARQACEWLELKRATLYAYVSRGLVSSRPVEGRRAREYRRADLARLAARQRARAGHGAVAAGALRWGEPVLDSSITRIQDHEIHIRGHALTKLAESSSFEDVVELLVGLTPSRVELVLGRHALSVAKRASSLCDAISAVVALDAMRASSAAPRPEPEVGRLCQLLPAAVAANQGVSPRQHRSQARAFLHAYGRRSGIQAVDAALILVADHGLNPSAFAGRVAAAAGASLHQSVLCALGPFSGAAHGAASHHVEDLLEHVRDTGAATAVRSLLSQHDGIPGFGHRLYPDGDPRFPPLLAIAEQIAPTRVRPVRDLCDAAALAGLPEPTVDLGLVALCMSLRLPRGAALALFACGRIAGWLAHALEQREAGFMVRPRARYIGLNPLS